MQRAALAIGARCVGQCTALRFSVDDGGGNGVVLLPFFVCGLLWLGVCAGGSFGAVWESVSDSQLGQKRRLPFILQPRFPFFYISVSEWKREASFARIASSLGPFVSVSEG